MPGRAAWSDIDKAGECPMAPKREPMVAARIDANMRQGARTDFQPSAKRSQAQAEARIKILPGQSLAPGRDCFGPTRALSLAHLKKQ